MKNLIPKFEDYIFKRKFNTRGLPLPKKMWRDGYNKALEDVLNFIKSEEKVIG